MLERAWQATFRNYATLFLIVASVTVPVHLVYSFAFHDVIAVSELHSDVEQFETDEQVKGVGAPDLARYRQIGLAICLAELVLLPLFIAAARRVIEQEAAEELPAVSRALLQAIGRSHPEGAAGAVLTRSRHRAPEVAIVGLLVAACIWVLARAIGMILIEPLPSGIRFAGAGLAEGIALATAAPFLLVPAVFSLLRKPAPA